MTLKPIIGRIGGKTKLKKKIVDEYFIDNYENMTYVEPFIGGGSIFFYKKKSIKEIINDLDKNVITIYKGIKKYDSNKVEADINGVYLKDKFNEIKHSNPKNKYDDFLKWFILFRTSFYCCCKSYSKERSKISISNLEKYKERLKNVTILNKDYKEVIKKYDSPSTFFYLDPPYENSKGLYKHYDVLIEELYNILKNIKGKFLLSYNFSDKAIELFKNDFNIYEISTSYNTNLDFFKEENKNINELLICNY